MKLRPRHLNPKASAKPQRDCTPHITEYSYLLAEMTPQERETTLAACAPEVREAFLQDLKALGVETSTPR